MKEKQITQTTARLAKRAGFYIPVVSFNVKDSRVTGFNRNPKEIYYKTGFPDFGYKASDLFIIVSQSVLQKWLREKYNIHVIPSWLYSGYGYSIYSTHWNRQNGILGTYENAMEKGLQEALKMILKEKK